MKLPLLALQGHLHYGVVSWVVLNVLLVITTLLLWSGVMARFARDIRVFTLSNIVLSSVLLSSTAWGISLSMPSIRNVEYALLALFLYLLFDKQYSLRRLSLAGGILALLAASDYFFLVVTPVAVLATIGLTALANHSASSFRAGLPRIITTIAGASAGLILLKVLEAFQLLKFHNNTQAVHAFSHQTPTLENILYEQVPVLITQLLKLMGGNIFGVPFSKSLLLCFVFLVVSILAMAAAGRVLRESYRTKTFQMPAALIVFLIVAICAYLANSLAHSGDANIRFISIIPFVLVTALVLQGLKKYGYVTVFTAAAVTLAAGALLAVVPNRHFYAAKEKEATSYVTTARKIAGALTEEKTSIAYATISWSSITWFYSHGEKRVYTISPCNLANPPLSNAGWFAGNNKSRSALIIDRRIPSYAKGESWHDCSERLLESVYDRPISKRYLAGESSGIELWFFNYNINSRLSN